MGEFTEHALNKKKKNTPCSLHFSWVSLIWSHVIFPVFYAGLNFLLLLLSITNRVFLPWLIFILKYATTEPTILPIATWSTHGHTM